jgi:UDP-glucose 4-epimerase
MKILITGCAGFIGSHLAEKLLEDHKVVGVDNFLLGKRENIAHLYKNPNFTFHETDILDYINFESIFRIHSFDCIFHLAANSDISNADAKGDFRNTLSTTLAVLEKMHARDIKEIIFASSGSVYGETKKKVSEHNYGLPISHYAAAKVSSEAWIESYSVMYGIKSWICRLPNVIGERMTHGAIYDFNKQIKSGVNELKVLGDGNQTKPYMYVKDVCNAMIFVWQNSKEHINVYNISTKGQTSVREIAEIITDLPKVYSGGDRGWNGDSPYYNADFTRLTELGFKAKMNSTQAVKYTISKL